jgi:hypothetical protein
MKTSMYYLRKNTKNINSKLTPFWNLCRLNQGKIATYYDYELALAALEKKNSETVNLHNDLFIV